MIKIMISFLILLQINFIFADLSEDLHYSRQTAITKAISKVSNAVVGINVTQLNTTNKPLF